jgi:hypothetical protein
VGRFGASFYVNCRDRFAVEAMRAGRALSATASTVIDEM